MLYSKSCQLVLFFASLLSANAVDTVDLKTAENYAILTKKGITTVPQSAITGDIAVSPINAAAMTGFSLTLSGDGTYSTSDQVTGTHKAYASDYAGAEVLLTQAILDMEAAYTEAESRSNDNDTSRTNLGGGGIGGETLTAGVYTFDTGVNVNSDLYIDGNATDIFIIQMTGNLVVAADKKVILQGGALAKNIFWQVAGTIDVGSKAHMEGIFLAKGVVAFVTGSSMNGRVFSQAQCTLQSTTIVSDTSSVRKNLRH